MPRLRLLTLITCVWTLVTPLLGAKFTWDPVDPSLLSVPAPSENLPDLDCLFLRMSYEGTSFSSQLMRYMRVKVNTTKGVESTSKLQIDLMEEEEISQLAVRILRTNGKIDELKDSQFIHSRGKKRKRGKEGKVTFAFPEIAPGDLIEIYHVSKHHSDIGVLMVPVQREFPVREFEFRFSVGLADRLVHWANTKAATSEKDGKTLVVRMKNLEPFIIEPNMPPVMDHIIWIGMIPVYGKNSVVNEWRFISAMLHDEFKDETHPNRAVKKLAAKIIGSETDKREKLRLLYDFVQTQLVHLSWDKSPEAEAVKRNRPPPSTDPWDTETVIARKMGFAEEIQALFGALTVAAGLEPKEVYFTRLPGISDIRSPQGWAYLTDSTYLFELDGKNFFCSPDDPWLPFGMRPWFDETIPAVVVDPKNLVFTTIGVSDPEANRIENTASLRLDAEGTLEGDVSISYWGQEAWKYKISRIGEKPEDFDRSYLDDFHEKTPRAEVSDLQWVNLQNRTYPLVVKFKVRIPNYAESLGDRLSMPLNLFESGSSSRFTESSRRFPILFESTLHSVTKIDLTLPTGFDAESPTAPQGVGNEQSAISVRYGVKLYENQRKVSYSRDFVLGRGPGKEFSAEQYAVFRKLFSLLGTGDSHVLLLKPSPLASSSATP